MSIRWCRSSRIAAPEPLVLIRNALGVANNFISAVDPIAKYLEYYAIAQRYIDDASTFLSAERLIAESAALGIREQVQDVLTDNGYFIQYSNFRQLVDRFGVGALVDSTEASLDAYENEDLSRIPGVRSTFPPRQQVTGGRVGSLFVNSSGFREIRESKSRRAVYSALDLAQGDRFESFESWLLPVLEAFYDVGDDQRPRWSPDDKVGGIIFTVEGSNLTEVQDRYKRLIGLFSNLSAPTLLPALNFKDILDSELIQNISDIRDARDAGKINQAEQIWRLANLFQTQALQPVFFEDLGTRTFTTSPDFLRAGTADLIPLLGRLYDLLDILAGLISPTLPFSFSLDKLAQSQTAFLAQLIEGLQNAEELLQSIIDIFELAGVSRLYVPLEKRTTNELVQEIYEATPTRNDLVRVYNNDVGAQFGGLPLFPGQLINQSQADDLVRNYPGLQIGPPGNVLVAGVGIFYTEGPLARLIESFFAPKAEDFDETDGGPSVLSLPDYINLVDGLREPLVRTDGRGRSTGPSTPPPTGVDPSSADPFLGPWFGSAGVQETNPRNRTNGTSLDYQQQSTDLASLRPDITWGYAGDANFVQLDPNERREGWNRRASMSSPAFFERLDPVFLNMYLRNEAAARAPVGESPQSQESEPEVDMPVAAYRLDGGDEEFSDSEALEVTIHPGGRTVSSATPLVAGEILYVRVRFEGRAEETYVRTVVRTSGTTSVVEPSLPAVPVIEAETEWPAYRRTSQLREVSATIPKTARADDALHPGWTAEALCSIRKIEEQFSELTESFLPRSISATRSLPMTLQTVRDGTILDAETVAAGGTQFTIWRTPDLPYLDLQSESNRDAGTLYTEHYWPFYETRHAGLEGGEGFAPTPPEPVRLYAGLIGTGTQVTSYQLDAPLSSLNIPNVAQQPDDWNLLRVRSPRLGRIGLGTVLTTAPIRVAGSAGQLDDVFVRSAGTWVRVSDAYTVTQDGPEAVITPESGFVSLFNGSDWFVTYAGDQSTDDTLDLIVGSRGKPLNALHANDLFLCLHGGPFAVAHGACPRGHVAAGTLAPNFHAEQITAPVILPTEEPVEGIPSRYVDVAVRFDVDTIEELGVYKLWETKSHFALLTINEQVGLSLHQKAFDLSSDTVLHSESIRHLPRGSRLQMVAGVGELEALIEMEATLPDGSSVSESTLLVLPTDPRPLEPYPGQAAIRIGNAEDFLQLERDFQSNSWTSLSAIQYGFLASEVESARLVSVTS